MAHRGTNMACLSGGGYKVYIDLIGSCFSNKGYREKLLSNKHYMTKLMSLLFSTHKPKGRKRTESPNGEILNNALSDTRYVVNSYGKGERCKVLIRNVVNYVCSLNPSDPLPPIGCNAHLKHSKSSSKIKRVLTGQIASSRSSAWYVE